MLNGQNLHFSRLRRFAVLYALPAVMAPAMAQMAPAVRSDANNLIPRTGGIPDVIKIVDLRKDSDQAEVVFAKSLQGLMNAEPIRTDKVYLVLNDQDQRLLDLLVKRQYVISTYTMHNLDELLLRWPSRDAVVCDPNVSDVAAAVAGCEGDLLVTDPALVQKYHLIVRKDLRGKWTSELEADAWLLHNYGSQLNTRIVGITPTSGHSLDLLDYQVANKMFTFSLAGDASDEATMQALVTKFDANIPCLFSGQTNPQAAADAVNKAAKFLIPVTGFSNLSVWTTFRPYQKGVEEIKSGTSKQPRALYRDPYGVPHGGWVGEDNRQGKMRMPWFREILPPVYESWARQRNGGLESDRDAFRMGMVNDEIYGTAYGSDRDRIWTDYLKISRDSYDLASGR